MPMPPWFELALFMALVLTVFVYVVAASGHFPSEHREQGLRGMPGTILIWGTIAVVAGSGLLALTLVYEAVPVYAAVIGGGLMILSAPYVLRPCPDSFVNGRAVLLLLAGTALVLDMVVWRTLA